MIHYFLVKIAMVLFFGGFLFCFFVFFVLARKKLISAKIKFIYRAEFKLAWS